MSAIVLIEPSAYCNSFVNELLHAKDGRQDQRPGLTTNKNISDIFQRLRHAGT